MRQALISAAVCFLLVLFGLDALKQSNVSNPPTPPIPTCADTAGQHLNFASGAWSCGTTSSTTPVTGTTGAIGGGALLVGTPATSTATVTGIAAGRPCIAAPSDGSSLTTVGSGLGLIVGCVVTSTNTATVYVGVTVAGTPTSKTYTVVAF